MIESRGISEDEAQRIFGGEHKARFRNCFGKAWQRWAGLPAGARKDLCARSRASIIYDFAATRAVEEFDRVSGVAIVDQRDSGGPLPEGFRAAVSAWGRVSLTGLALSLLEKLGDLPLCCLPQPLPQE